MDEKLVPEKKRGSVSKRLVETTHTYVHQATLSSRDSPLSRLSRVFQLRGDGVCKRTSKYVLSEEQRAQNIPASRTHLDSPNTWSFSSLNSDPCCLMFRRIHAELEVLGKLDYLSLRSNKLTAEGVQTMYEVWVFLSFNSVLEGYTLRQRVGVGVLEVYTHDFLIMCFPVILLLAGAHNAV